MGQIRRPAEKRETLLAAGTPFYRKYKLAAGLVGSVQIIWHDATSSFTVAAYTSNVEKPPVPADGAAGPSAEWWHDETTPGDILITGAAASAIGCDLVHLGNNGAKWLLLKFTVAADSDITIIVHEKE
jgi:hypothetical protein